MRERSDQFIKSLLRDALRRMAESDTEVEVAAATQRIDVWCVPDPAREAVRRELGVLGELAAGPCMFEVFRNTPGLRHMRDCLRKQLAWHHELERRARTAPDRIEAPPASRNEVPFPWLIVVSTGRPETVLDGYGCQALSPGVYGPAPALHVRVVVLSELPRTRSTLILRLMGARWVLREALQDLMALPEDAWERSVALPLLVHFGYEIPGQLPEDVEDDVIMEIQEWFKSYQAEQRQLGLDEGKRLGLDEGKRLGLDEGKRLALARLFEKRLGRAMTDDERSTLAERLARLGEERLDEVVLTLDGETLAAWLANPEGR
ncbi:hypothetical protein WMF26_02725 [Sorangium sp. So ce185]|uniref:hypothetical protein n=1 Tax=Sorangium sp. So ce185 TaxID=3133287 RepID=UPI003F60ED76